MKILLSNETMKISLSLVRESFKSITLKISLSRDSFENITLKSHDYKTVKHNPFKNHDLTQEFLYEVLPKNIF